MRATMRDVLGVDVGDRLVHRGPAVSAEARAMDAQAFTRDGQVHVADEVGPLDTPTGRATLAHEMTHAAQQIVHGTLHDEASPTGRALEAHAQQVEQFVRGDGGAIEAIARSAARPSADHRVRPMPIRVASTRQMMRELVDSGLAARRQRRDHLHDAALIDDGGDRHAAADDERARRTAGRRPARPRRTGSGLEHVRQPARPRSRATTCSAWPARCSASATSSWASSVTRSPTQNREFERNQTKQAYTELRMEHLRTAALQQFNDESPTASATANWNHSTRDHDAGDPRSASSTRSNSRMQVLARADRSSPCVSSTKPASGDSEPALEEVPDESFDVAFHRLFDDPEHRRTADRERAPDRVDASPDDGDGRRGTTRRRRRRRGLTRVVAPALAAPVARAEAPASHLAGAAAGARTGAASHASGGGPGTGGAGTGTAHADEPWRTADTMRGRFAGLGNALVGDIAHAEVGFFGSMLGFDQQLRARPARPDPSRDTPPPEPPAAGAHGATDAAHGAAAAPRMPPAHTPLPRTPAQPTPRQARLTRPSTTSSAIRTPSTNWPTVSTPTSAAGCARNC